MVAPYVRSVGPTAEAAYQETIEVPLPPHAPGDILIVHSAVADPGGGGIHRLRMGSAWTILAEIHIGTNAGLNNEALWWRVADSGSTPNPTVSYEPYSGTDGWVAQAISVAGAASAQIAAVNDPSVMSDGALHYAGGLSEADETLLVSMAHGQRYGGFPPITYPSPIFETPGSTVAGLNEYEQETSLYRTRTVWRTSIIDSSTTTAMPVKLLYVPDEETGEGWFAAAWWVALEPLPPPPEPVSPTPPARNLRLGCPSEYGAYITDGTYDRVIERLTPASIRWTRELDEISTVRVHAPREYGGLQCCVKHGGLAPASFGLLIERNGERVWTGMVTNVANGSDVDGADVLARLTRRRALSNLPAEQGSVSYEAQDAGAVLADLFNNRFQLPSDQFNIQIPPVLSGSLMTRTSYARQLEMAWPLTREILDASVDMTVVAGKILVHEPGTGWKWRDTHRRRDMVLDAPYDSNGAILLSTFTQQAFTKVPPWNTSWENMANWQAVHGPDGSEFGYRHIGIAENTVSQGIYGVIDDVEPSTLLRDDDTVSAPSTVLTDEAKSLVALRGYPPLVIGEAELSENAPVSVDLLIPGSIWILDVYDDCYGQLLTSARLKRVTVDVSIDGNGGMSESVKVALQPLGTEG